MTPTTGPVPSLLMNNTTTYHTYADLLTDGGRLAATNWGSLRSCSAAEAVAATLRHDPEAVVLRVTYGVESAKGYAPGGLAA